MTKRPLSVSAALFLVLLNAFFWLAFGVIVVANAHPGLPDLPFIKEIMAFLAFVTVVLLLVLFVFLGKRNRIAYFLTLGFLAVISLLTILDDFGLADLVVLVMNIAPIIFLVKDRAWYLQVRHSTVDNQKAA